MNRDRLRDRLKTHEGYRQEPYRDHLGNWTVGHGHLLHVKPTRDWPYETLGGLLDALSKPEQHDLWLEQDIDAASRSARNWFHNFEDFSDIRQEVLVELCFQMGNRTRGFVKFHAAAMRGDWEEAARELIDSRWAEQTPTRAKRLTQLFRDGA